MRKLSKRFCLFLIPLCVTLALSNCIKPGLGRDLSTPSTRLVGHWIDDHDGWHEYYGPIDPKTKIGDYVQVVDGEAFYTQYRVVSEELDGVRITTFLFIEAENFIFPDMNWIIDKDGMKRHYEGILSNSWTYVDNKIEP